MDRHESLQSKDNQYFNGNEWQLPTDLNVAEGALGEFNRRLEEAKWPEDDIDWLAATFSEVIYNAIIHGNLGIHAKSEEESWKEVASRVIEEHPTDKKVLVRINITEEQLEVTVRDEGEGFDWKNQKESKGLEKTSGKGMTFMKTFFDSYQYNDKGNEVTLIKKRPPTNNKKIA